MPIRRFRPIFAGGIASALVATAVILMPTSATAAAAPTITGTITTADGVVPAGTHVWLEAWDTRTATWIAPADSRATADDSTGAFSFSGHGAGDYRVLVIPPVGFVPEVSDRITLTPAEYGGANPAEPVHLELPSAPIITIRGHVANFRDEPGGVSVTSSIEFASDEPTTTTLWQVSDTPIVGDPATGDITLLATSGVPTNFSTANVGALAGNALPDPDDRAAHVYTADTDLSAFDDMVLHPQPGITDSVRPYTLDVTGIAGKGHTLRAATSDWYPTRHLVMNYQWYRDGEPIAGATSAHYVATLEDAGADVTVAATGSHPGFETHGARSTPTAIPLVVKTPAPQVAITGVLAHGRTLTAKVTHAPAGATVAYRWYSAGTLIPGATRSTYVPTSAVVGHTISLHVTVTTPHYTTTTAAARATGLVAR